MDPETQIGLLQDQVHGFSLEMQGFRLALEGVLKKQGETEAGQTKNNESIIRLEEAVKGIREQNKEHAAAQTKLLTDAATNISTLLSAMGIDPNKPETIMAVRHDFIDLRRMRTKRESAWDWFTKSLIGGIVAAALLALWEGIKANART